ncbi:MAG: 3-oxoacyl-(acyl-carrier-protein) synthase 2 [Bacteroidetes bacterium ADurb.Bin217]|nr:MAG: 3-oxoacyl-(acyl-carrier-protein) synthase 2 [Bacteroidetes bacterium ADurb.Bin217]HOS84202.1 beta-ketoacyl-ACP synthase II [Bacteroidales bacterium]
MELKRVVVTGIGAFTPIGNTVEEIFKNLKNGVSGSAPITYFNTEKFKTKFACEVKNFDISLYVDRKEARKMDPYAHFAMAAAAECLQDSKLQLDTIDLDSIGVIWGSGIGGLTTFQTEVTAFAQGDGTPRFNPFFIPKMISNIAAGYISIRYGLRGASYATTSACASSTHAMIDAFNYIRLGKAKAYITGGSEATINESGVGGFNAMKALSENNDEMVSASRPFDGTRDGFVMGEGGVALLFEEYEHAIARGAKIYAEVAGGGMSSDAHHLTAPHPEGLGAGNVMKWAIEDAGIKLTDIDYINVHGTATPLGDIAETNAIIKLFGDHAYKLNISSTKSMTGHLLGAAGAMETVASIFALQTGIVPPTINFKEADPNIDSKLNLTLNEAQQRNVEYALSNTFGFGGHNGSIILKKYKG